MLIPGLIILCVAFLLVWTLTYHAVINWRVRGWRLAGWTVGAVVLVGLASTLLVWDRYQDHQETIKANAAVESFIAAHPEALLTRAVAIDDVWVFDYLNSGDPHVVVKLGQDWLEVKLP